MALAVWTEQYRVGSPVLDGQHQTLFRLVKELQDATAKAHSNELLDAILDQLIQEARRHFRDEEALLVRCRYPGYSAHRAEHHALTTQVLELQRALRCGETAVTPHVVQFMTNWLDQHLRRSDLLYVPYMNKESATTTPAAAIPASR